MELITADIFCIAGLCLARRRIGTVTYTCQLENGHNHLHTDNVSASWDGNAVCLTHDEMLRRWPRTVAAMQWTLIGTQSEACDAVSGLLSKYGGGSEAVMHFGGAKKVLKTAFHCRKYLRTRPDYLNRYVTASEVPG